MFAEECPRCGSTLKVKKWMEEGYLVETKKDCPDCGYTYHWSYGSVIESGDEGDNNEQEMEHTNDFS